MRRNKKGFTLVELVIVIAVIAILAAVLLPTFSNVIANAKLSSATQRAKSALKEFYSVEGAKQAQDTNFNMDSMENWVIVAEVGDGEVDYLFTINKAGALTEGTLLDHDFATPYTNIGTFDKAEDETWYGPQYHGEYVVNVYDNCYIYVSQVNPEA